MNGVLNAIFIVILFMGLIAFDYLYTIGDRIANGMIATVESNPISDAGFNAYKATRDMMFNLVVNILTPFLIFLSFTSSFVNRNQNVVFYLIQVFAVLMLTPMLIFIFAEIFTNLLAFSLLDPAYMATVYFDNFLMILVVNMLLALASFVFVKQTATEVTG